MVQTKLFSDLYLN